MFIYAAGIPIATFAIWAFTYKMNGGDENIFRALRRDIRMIIPGKIGRQTRLTWTRKQIIKLARYEQKGCVFSKNGKTIFYRNIAASNSYNAYIEDFCVPRKVILFCFAESLLMGVFWLPILIFLLVNALIYDITRLVKWFYAKFKHS